MENNLVESNTVIGIDLGTTNICISYVVNGKVKVLRNEEGYETTPSHIVFEENNVLIGNVAKTEAGISTENVVYDIKRMMGRSFEDPEIKNDLKYWPFKVVKNRLSPFVSVPIQFQGKKYLLSPEELSALILKKIKLHAEKILKTNIKSAVITVPANFNNSQRRTTFDAGQIAGFKQLEILSEPTATVLAYAFTRGESWGDLANILVFDIGGGTCDISLLDFTQDQVIVKGTIGDTQFGGNDFDDNMVEFATAKFKKGVNAGAKLNLSQIYRLRLACECAKQELSSVDRTIIHVDNLYGENSLSMIISRDEFEQICKDLFDLIIPLLTQLLNNAGVLPTDIDRILLAGGSTKIPAVS